MEKIRQQVYASKLLDEGLIYFYPCTDAVYSSLFEPAV